MNTRDPDTPGIQLTMDSTIIGIFGRGVVSVCAVGKALGIGGRSGGSMSSSLRRLWYRRNPLLRGCRVPEKEKMRGGVDSELGVSAYGIGLFSGSCCCNGCECGP